MTWWNSSLSPKPRPPSFSPSRLTSSQYCARRSSGSLDAMCALTKASVTSYKPSATPTPPLEPSDAPNECLYTPSSRTCGATSGDTYTAVPVNLGVSSAPSPRPHTRSSMSAWLGTGSNPTPASASSSNACTAMARPMRRLRAGGGEREACRGGRRARARAPAATPAAAAVAAPLAPAPPPHPRTHLRTRASRGASDLDMSLAGYRRACSGSRKQPVCAATASKAWSLMPSCTASTYTS